VTKKELEEMLVDAIGLHHEYAELADRYRAALQKIAAHETHVYSDYRCPEIAREALGL
jgi:hypothetical protein